MLGTRLVVTILAAGNLAHSEAVMLYIPESMKRSRLAKNEEEQVWSAVTTHTSSLTLMFLKPSSLGAG